MFGGALLLSDISIGDVRNEDIEMHLPRKRHQDCLKAVIGAILLGTAMSGCATVNLNKIAETAMADTPIKQSVNVVQRAASSLYSVFKDRGFAPDMSRKRLQSAASVLLNGFENAESDASVLSEDVLAPRLVVSDVLYARGYVDRTVTAAEIYLEVSPVSQDLREDLASLEKALIASHKAEQTFKLNLATSDNIEMKLFSDSVENLRVITNAFGDRVRLNDTDKLTERDIAQDS